MLSYPYLSFNFQYNMAEDNLPAVVFTDLCKRCQREFGIKNQDIENMARNFTQRYSMALQRIDEDWSLIGEVERRNNELRVGPVFKIPNSMIEHARSDNVFDVLAQFVAEFGVEIRLGPVHGRLIRGAVIRIQPGQNIRELMGGAFPRSGEVIPMFNLSEAQNPEGERAVRINYAFAIDVGRYRGIIP